MKKIYSIISHHNLTFIHARISEQMKILLSIELHLHALISTARFVSLILLCIISWEKSHAQLFQQNFSGSTLLSDYFNANPTPNQFDNISAVGGMNVNIETIGYPKLRYTLAGSGTGMYVRNTNFSSIPSSMVYQFDLRVSDNSTSTNSAASWAVGQDFDSTNQISIGVHSRIWLNISDTDGNFSLAHTNAAVSSQNFSGIQRITWVINHSSNSIIYYAPDNTVQNVAIGKEDVWIGNTNVFNEIDAVDGIQNLSDIKFVFNTGEAKVDLSNFFIDPIPEIPVSLPASNITPNSFTANWTLANNANAYRVEVATDSAFVNKVTAYADSLVNSPLSNQLIITGLIPQTNYYYRIRGVNYYGTNEVGSGYSLTQSVSTFCTPPADPSGTITTGALNACGSTTLGYSETTIPPSAGINYWQTSASGTVTTFPANGTSTYTVSSSGIYYVRKRDSVTSCWSLNALATGNITVNPIPDATISGSDTVCQNSAPMPISFVGSNGTMPYTFKYRINLGALQSVTTLVGSNMIDILAPSQTVSNSVYHLLSVEDANNCSQHYTSDSINLKVNPLPNAIILGDTTVCSMTGASVPITFIGSSGTPSYNISYKINGGPIQTISTGAGNSSMVLCAIDNPNTWVYNIVSITDANSCSQIISASAIVQVNQTFNGSISASENSGIDPNDGIICEGDSVILTVIGGTNSLWSNGDTTSSITVLSTDIDTTNERTYTVTTSSGGNCQSTDTLTVKKKKSPDATISGTTEACKNQGDAKVITFKGSNGFTPYTFTYKLNDGPLQSITTQAANDSEDTHADIDVVDTLIFKLFSVSDSNGCERKKTNDSAVVTVNDKPLATITAPLMACHLTNAPIILTGLNGEVPYRFKYKFDNGSSIPITTNGTNDTVHIASTDLEGQHTYELDSVIDANGCFRNYSINKTINVKPNPTAIILGYDTVVCKNGMSPKLSFVGSNGTAPYTFSYKIDSGQTQSVTNSSANDTITILSPTIIAGTFKYQLLSVTDSNGCITSYNDSNKIVTIKINSLPNASISGSDTVCSKPDSVAITFFGSLGTPPYSISYKINGGAIKTITTGAGDSVSVFRKITNPNTWVYSIFSIADANSCSRTDTGIATIVINSSVNLSISASDNSGLSSSDGVICEGDIVTLTAIGGTEHSWNTGATIPSIIVTSDSIDILNGRTYTITATLDSTCPNSKTFTVKKNKLPTATINGTATVCSDPIGNKPITLKGQNGTRPYIFTYQIYNGPLQTVSTVGLSDEVVILQPINVASSFKYSLISVSDSNGCSQFYTLNDTATIIVNPSVIGSISETDNSGSLMSDNIICKGNQAILAANGGSSYKWLDDTTITDSIRIVTPASTTTYTIEISNGGNCPAIITTTIFVKPIPDADIVASSTSVCKNSSDTVNLKGLLGTAPYNFIFKFNNGPDSFVNTSSSNPNYQLYVPTTNDDIYSYKLVSVQDANACIKFIPPSDSVVIIVNPLPSATITGATSVCKDELAPKITLKGNNGKRPFLFTYRINLNTPISISSLPGQDSVQISVPTNIDGTYTYSLISVSDSNTCFQPLSGSAIIKINPLPSASIQGTTNACKNTGNRLIVLTGSLGTRPYIFKYKINNGIEITDTTSSGQDTFQIIANTDTIAGDYIYSLISVADANGCIQPQVGQATLTVNPLPNVTFQGGDTVCQNSTPPNVIFSGTGGTKPYTFAYSLNGINQTSLTLGAIQSSTSLSVSTNIPTTLKYKLVSMTDVKGCSPNMLPFKDTSVILINPLPFAFISGSSTACQNSGSRIITLTGNNGTSPYTFSYKINNGSPLSGTTSVGLDIIQLEFKTDTTNGIYNYNLIEVSDSNGCVRTQTGSVNMTIHKLPSATIQGSDTVCQNSGFPIISFSGFGGTDPYIFYFNKDLIAQLPIQSDINGMATYISQTNLSGHFVYTLDSVSDANGCHSTLLSALNQVDILVNPLPSASISGDTAVCQGGNSPHIIFTALNGISPFTFSFNIFNGYSNQIISIPSLNDTLKYSTIPTNDTGNFAYKLLTIIDSNGCQQNYTNDSVIVRINPLPNASIAGSNTTCYLNGGIHAIQLIGGNGTAPYKFRFSINGGNSIDSISSFPNSTVQIFAPLDIVGNYIYKLDSVSDANGCSQSQTGNAILKVNPLPLATISGSAPICKNSAQAYIKLSGLAGTQPYTFKYQQLPDTAILIKNTLSGSDSAIVLGPTNGGTYIYSLKEIIDANGCLSTLNDSITIVVYELPDGSIQISKDTVCQYADNSEITLTGSLGLPPYKFEYDINPGISDIAYSGLNSIKTIKPETNKDGLFTYKLIKITDNNGCVQPLLEKVVKLSVLAEPGEPLFSAGLNENSLDSMTFCAGSSNLAFSIKNIKSNIKYSWSADPSDVKIGSPNHPHTAMSFPQAGFKNIYSYSETNRGCRDTSSKIVHIASNPDRIEPRKIILKQPGNILIYPDNTMDSTYDNGIDTVHGYQWGYNEIKQDTLGPPKIFKDQIYQVFIPEEKYVTQALGLDTSNYAFWVSLKNGDCQSLVYYNGPYAHKLTPPSTLNPENVIVEVYPNPGFQKFNVNILGKIYGKLNVNLFNALGQKVYATTFVKKHLESNFTLQIPVVPEGIYLMELSSLDKQQYLIKISVKY